MKNLTKPFPLIILVIAIAILSGCETKENKTEQTEQTSGITVTDGTGQKVTLSKTPKTIISLMPSSTEILYALDASDKLIGVSDFCNYPTEAMSKEKFGAMEINVEGIIAKKPDLIILSEYHQKTYAETVKQFQSLGIDVLTIKDAADFAGTYETIHMLGKVTDTEPKATKIVNNMKADVEAIKKLAMKTNQKKVWVEISPSPDIYTAGKGTFVDEMLTMIGADNIAKDIEGWGKLSDEVVVQANPDVIITTYGSYQPDPELQVINRSGWEQIQAVKNKQVFDLNNDELSRPGPRLIEGLAELAEAIYPEQYAKLDIAA